MRNPVRVSGGVPPEGGPAPRVPRGRTRTLWVLRIALRARRKPLSRSRSALGVRDHPWGALYFGGAGDGPGVDPVNMCRKRVCVDTPR